MGSQEQATEAPTSAIRLGAAIRNRRMSAGLSQEDLGFAANTHRTYIGVIERGEKEITVAKLIVLAAALGCAASDLLEDCGL